MKDFFSIINLIEIKKHKESWDQFQADSILPKTTCSAGR